MHDHLLHDTTCIIGYSAIVADDDFNLSSSYDVALLLDIKPDRGCKLATNGIKSGPSHRYADSGDGLCTEQAAGEAAATWRFLQLFCIFSPDDRTRTILNASPLLL